MKAMILAAGMGSRLQPLTITKPKVLIEIGGLTMLEHQINYLKYYGVNEIIINVHHFADQIIEFIRSKNFNCQIEISHEKDKLLDTGGGLKKASWFFNDGKPFFLLGSDMFTDLDLNDLLTFHKKNNPLATVAVKKRNSTREFLIDEDNYLCGWRNNITNEEIISRKTAKKISSYGFSVIHVINPLLFNYMDDAEVFTMTNLYLQISANKPIMAFKHDKSEWYEFGRLQNLYDEAFLNNAQGIILKYQQ